MCRHSVFRHSGHFGSHSEGEIRDCVLRQLLLSGFPLQAAAYRLFQVARTALDVKNVANVVIALKKPIEMGKRRLDCICLPLDNHTDRKMMFEDKKRQVNGKAYSIFLTILKLKFPFTVIALLWSHV